jgi:hypothetical protein
MFRSAIRTVPLLLAIAGLATAQETRSVIFGRVNDPSGAPVPAASVAVINTGTGTRQGLTTNDTGYYEANLLLPGEYQVTVEKQGFKKIVRSGLTLQVSSRLEVAIQLELGQITDTVSVTAEPPLLETSSISTGRVMDNKTIMNLPVLGNSVTLLVKLTPGVFHGGVNNELALHSNAGGSDYNTAGNVGGNSWSIDGAPNNGPTRRTAYLPYSDTVAEFKVETSNFDAAIGATTGIVVSMISKSGTNNYHGTATWQHWQRRFNGTPFFVKQQYYRNIAAAEAAGNTTLANQLRSQDKQPTGRSNNWAATIGGPITIPKVINGRNKLFYFFSYNGFKDVKTEDPNSINRTVATLKMRQGDFTEFLGLPTASQFVIHDPRTTRPDPARPGQFVRDPIPGNIIPQNLRLNRMYDSYVKLLPNPNAPGTPEFRNNYLAVATPYNWDYFAFSNRIDYNINDKHRLFGRWSWNDFIEDRGDWTYESARGLHTNGLNRNNKAATLDYVWTVSSQTILNFTASANQFREGDRITVPLQFKPSDVGLPSYMDEFAGSQNILPFIDFSSSYTNIGRGGVPVNTFYRSWTGKVEATHIRGPHTIRGGFESRSNHRQGGGGGNTSGNFTFGNNWTRRTSDNNVQPASTLSHSWAAFLLGYPNGVSIARNDTFVTTSPWYGWFLQDSFRVNSKLTVNYGFRLEWEGGPTERFNRMIVGFDPTATLPITQLAQESYARTPIAERSAADFKVLGGSYYANSKGRGREFWPAQLMFMPRAAVAYQLNSKTVLRLGYGMFFDTLNVLNEGISQTNFSRSTGSILTNDNGQTFLTGIPPTSNPFPIRADGTRFDEPTRDALGLMAVAGRGFTYNGDHLRRARQQRWRAGAQRQFGRDWVVEAAYAGSYSDNVYVDKPENRLPGSFWATGNVRDNARATFLNENVTNPFRINNFASLQTSDPLVYRDMASIGFFTNQFASRSQLLRPRPHLGDLNLQRHPGGATKTHNFEVSANKRFAQGFNFNVGYTGMYIRDADIYLNPFDPTPTWRLGNDGRPHRFTMTTVVELPFGKGRKFANSGILSWLVGGFTMTATYEWQPGALLDWGNLFYYGQDYDDIRVSRADRTLGRWINTDNFERNPNLGPAAFHARVFPTRIQGIRADATSQWNANILREIPILGEALKMQLRFDALNLQNRSQFNGPNLSPSSLNFGAIESQTSATNRFLQFQARLVF